VPVLCSSRCLCAVQNRAGWAKKHLAKFQWSKLAKVDQCQSIPAQLPCDDEQRLCIIWSCLAVSADAGVPVFSRTTSDCVLLGLCHHQLGRHVLVDQTRHTMMQPQRGSALRGQSSSRGLTCSTASRNLSRRLVRAASVSKPNGHHSNGNDDPFKIHRQGPEQLERAWLETADGLQLADEFFTPHKGPEQQSKVFVFVRHGHSTWNEQSRIQASGDRLGGSCSAGAGTATVQHHPAGSIC
jgi:hypothetical protein